MNALYTTQGKVQTVDAAAAEGGKEGRAYRHDHKRQFNRGSGTQLWVQVMVLFSRRAPLLESYGKR